jgi:hypothetical protein
MRRDSRAAKVQQWTNRLARFQSCGQTVAKFCQSEAVSVPSFYQWKRKLAVSADAAQVSPGGASAFQALEFQSIELKPLAPAMTTIRLPQGIAIEFPSDRRMLEAWLQQLLSQALTSGASRC